MSNSGGKNCNTFGYLTTYSSSLKISHTFPQTLSFTSGNKWNDKVIFFLVKSIKLDLCCMRNEKRGFSFPGKCFSLIEIHKVANYFWMHEDLYARLFQSSLFLMMIFFLVGNWRNKLLIFNFVINVQKHLRLNSLVRCTKGKNGSECNLSQLNYSSI